MEMPEINMRIKQLIDLHHASNVKKFAESISIPQQSINRLFNIDTRTGKYPTATTDIVKSITELYVDLDARWLLTGKGSMLIDSPTVSHQKSEAELKEDRLLSIIESQQDTIKELGRKIK